jgi:hypothetical protein
MWDKIAEFILRYKLILLLILFAITVYMGYRGREAKLNYAPAPLVPSSDADMQFYEKFVKDFGLDENVMAFAMQDASVYKLDKFKRFAKLCEDIQAIDGITEVLSITRLQYLNKDTTNRRFVPEKIFQPFPTTQAALDKALQKVHQVRIYATQLMNRQNGALLTAVALKKEFLYTSKRIPLIEKYKTLCQQFEKETGIKLHYSGLPYVRTAIAQKIGREMNFFLWISAAITALVVFVFYRSLYPVLVSVGLIVITIIWALGTLAIFNYKITLLTGLMPPILVIVAIPNAIYLITKYQQEYLHSGNQQKALAKVISKIGFVTIIVNVTTAVSFFVFIWGEVPVLRDFGIATGLNTCFAFVISIIFVPSVFSYLPPPNVRDIQHLDFKPMKRLLDSLVVLTEKYRWLTYTITIVLVVLGVYGMTRVKALAYMVDDIPKDSPIKQDLYFFERNFKGVMPLEIIIDTGKPKRATKQYNVLQKIDSVERYLTSLPELQAPLSYINLLKTATQAYYLGDSASYRLPTKNELPFIGDYITASTSKDSLHKGRNLLKSFIDSTEQRVRISLKIADIGTVKIDSLLNKKIIPALNKILEGTKLQAKVTGSSVIFAKGNDYLIDSLISGTWMAVLLVAIAHGLLFFNLRIVIISLVPNIIPLVLTGGLMGFLGIPLKPSTIIIFSIVLGIAVDNTVHFLARYRLALLDQEQEGDFDVMKATIVSIRETGYSMIYTSVALLGGFVIFMVSEFGGTVALGGLTSLTLLVALITNLTLLPALLITFDKEKKGEFM